jgi:uncharacterized RDD family membrane protein YckC
VTTGAANKWNLDPGETLRAVARVVPPGRIEAQSTGNGFELALTNRRLLVSKRRAWRNKDRTSIVEQIPLDDITAVRTEKRHPAATFGIPLFRLDVVRHGDLETCFSCEAGSFGVRHLQGLAAALVDQRPELATAPWPDPPALQPAIAGGVGTVELSEEQRRALAKAKRRLTIAAAVLVAVTTAGIILWRSEDHPGASFTPATLVLLVALQILLYAWQLWEGIRRSTRPLKTVGDAGPSLIDVRCAAFWRRATGFLIDAVAVIVIAFFADLVVLALAHPLFGADVNFDANSQVGSNVFVAAVPILFFSYPVVLIATRGQTLGMQFLRIRLYAIADGGSLEKAGGWKAVGRTLMSLTFLCALLIPALIDYLWALSGPRHQCLHDKWSRTIALDTRNGPPEPSSSTASAGALETVSGD